MKRRSVVFVLAFVSLAVSCAGAQSTTDFSGRWTLVRDPGVGPDGPFGELGQRPVVTQDAKTLTVVTMLPSGELKSVYQLDGSESKNPIRILDLTIDRVSTVKWDGPRLLFNTTMNFNGVPVDSAQTWSLNSAGELVVDTLNNAQGKQTTTKRTYRKN